MSLLTAAKKTLLSSFPLLPLGSMNRTRPRRRYLPPRQPHSHMNPDPLVQFFCPIDGCPHSSSTGHSPFPTKTSLPKHLNTDSHKFTHHLTNHSVCQTIGIYTCCHSTCPSTPSRFFGSERKFNLHTTTYHPPPNPPPHATSTSLTPLALCTDILHCFSQPRIQNHWEHGLAFISSTYNHEPPDFRTSWHHFLTGRNKSSFRNLQAAIIRAITASYCATTSIHNSAPFWWLLLHLDILFFAPSTQHQQNNDSIQQTIRDRISTAFSGDIQYLFESAMQVQRLTQNSCSTHGGQDHSTQRAADCDEYRTAVSRACHSQSIATIGRDNIMHVKKLYTSSVPDLGYPDPNTIPNHQQYSLVGDICDTILHAAKNKGTGVNADSIDLFTSLVKCNIPTVKQDLNFIFNQIYRNNIPPIITRYFTDVYLFCLHKDSTDHTKLHPLSIPTAIRCLIASHLAKSMKDKFASYLLPYNYAVGIPDGSSFVVKAMQLAIECYIDMPQRSNRTPTRAAVFFDLTNQFNSVSRQEFFDVISKHFPELLPLTTLFYANPMTVHHKWEDGTWRQLLMDKGVSQGCPLSPLFASFVVACLLQPIDALLRECAATRLASRDTMVTTAMAAFHSSSPSLMTFHAVFTLRTFSSSAIHSNRVEQNLDASSTHPKLES
jgi:hypothetical protein